MNLNSAPRAPFENRTNGTEKSGYKEKNFVERKSEARVTRWGSKEQLKKSESESGQKFVYKDFIKSIKEIENEGIAKILKVLVERIRELPQNLHWQVLMELADLAKRENKIEDARKLLGISVKVQPCAHQAWLEYSKLEEECGRMGLARKFLMLGLHFAPASDQLAVKFIKIEEKLGNISTSRNILGGLRDIQIEKNWKILLEGSLMEARAGNIPVARSILSSLIYHCETFGAVYLESIKFEEKWGTTLDLALNLCEKGIQKNARYGPLWFAYLRVLEKSNSFSQSPNETRRKQEFLISEAEKYLSKELLWKLYLDFALFHDKNSNYEDCKKYLKLAVTTAPENLRWKAWVAVSRVEMKAGKSEIGIKLLNVSNEEVPSKQRPLVLVELSQCYELLKNYLKAREIMTEACEKSKHDWKIYLERINQEMRCACFSQALCVAKEAVSKYPSTGRLWASLIQLLHSDKGSISEDLQFKAFLLAVQEVPKSGEVWCEGGRLSLNPFTRHYDLNKAEVYLTYAIQFTPQYGDSFLELLRVYLLQGNLAKISALKKACINADPNYGMLWFYCKHSSLESPKEVWKRGKFLIKNEICRMKKTYENPLHLDWIDQMWTGITEANWSYSRNSSLDLSSRSKLIYGSEGLIL